MRRVLIGMAMAAVTSLLPSGLFAGDMEVAQSVANNLKNSGRLKHYNVQAQAKDGVVVLVGSVASEEQAAAAVEVAQQTPGVDRVYEKLTIASTPVTPTSLRQPGLPPAPVADEAELPRAQQRKAALPAYEGGQIPAATMPDAEPATRTNYQAPRGKPLGTPIGAPRQAVRPAAAQQGVPGEPIPAYAPGTGGGVAPAHYDHAHMPNYAWPSYAAYPNYAAVTYPKQYSPTAWPYIGPFYPYPQVPLGWRKVTLEWDDGWWFLDFDDKGCHHR